MVAPAYPGYRSKARDEEGPHRLALGVPPIVGWESSRHLQRHGGRGWPKDVHIRWMGALTKAPLAYARSVLAAAPQFGARFQAPANSP